MYYSTEWCDGVTTYARPPGKLDDNPVDEKFKKQQ